VRNSNNIIKSSAKLRTVPSELYINYKPTVHEIGFIASFLSQTPPPVPTTKPSFFTSSTSGGTNKIQWQIHPLTTGPLRYSIVEINPASQEHDQLPNADDNRAMYHRIQTPVLSLYTVKESEGYLTMRRWYLGTARVLYIMHLESEKRRVAPR
jgi:hypothetical protein